MNDFLTLAFLISTVAAIIIGPWIIRVLTNMKARQTISEDAPKQHMQKQGTPTMGGIIILIGAVVGVCAVIPLISKVERAHLPILPVMLLTLASGGLGFLDDFLIIKRGKNLGLKARHKLLGQFLIAIGFMAWIHGQPGQTVVHFGRAGMDLGWAYYPLAVLFIVGMSNAVNLTDGLDGLVSGLTAIVGLGIGFFAMNTTSIIGVALGGACLGFLWYNCYPAKIFMGDTGSLAIGAGLAGVAIACKQEILLLVLGVIFVIEALSVTIQVISFKTTGRRVFKMSPIHHHFELSGWPEQKIVVRFWIVQALIALATIVILMWSYRFE